MNNAHPEFGDVQILELKPPQHGKTWDNPHYQQEFELVSSVFKFFLGVDWMRMFKLEKFVLPHNQKLESKFRQTYHAMANGEQKPASSKKDDNVEPKMNSCRQATLTPMMAVAVRLTVAVTFWFSSIADTCVDMQREVSSLWLVFSRRCLASHF